VLDLLDSTGKIISFEDFASKLNLFDREQYAKVIKAIPQTLIASVYNSCQNIMKPNLPSLLVNDHNFTNIKLPNLIIRQTVIKELYPTSFHRNSFFLYSLKKRLRFSVLNLLNFPLHPKRRRFILRF